MWNTIKTTLKNNLPEATYKLWIEPTIIICSETGAEKLEIPNKYYQQTIQKLAKENGYETTDNNYIINDKPFPKVIKAETTKTELEEYIMPECDIIEDNRPYNIAYMPYYNACKNKIEYQETFTPVPLIRKEKIEIRQMNKPYTKHKIATTEKIDARLFSYPKQKQPNLQTKNIIQNGQSYTFSADLKKALTTTHLRILLALIHYWQLQNCQYEIINYDTPRKRILIKIKLTEILKMLELKNNTIKKQQVEKKLEELQTYPIIITNNNTQQKMLLTYIEKTHVGILPSGEKIYKIELNNSITNHLINQQNISMLNANLYKIKSPTTLKFILTYQHIIHKNRTTKIKIEKIRDQINLNTKTTKATNQAINRIIPKLINIFNKTIQLQKINNHWYTIIN